MKAPKRARPDLEWPWCDTCEAHVREVNGVKHACVHRDVSPLNVQLEFGWARPELALGGNA